MIQRRGAAPQIDVGRIEPLLWVQQFNPSFDGTYYFRNLLRLPKGTKIEVTAHFDNSKFNPFNPDATKAVRNGPQTFHEMMFGFFFYTKEGEDLNLNINPKTGWRVAPPK